MIIDLYGIKEALDNEKIIFCFYGPISQVFMVEIGDVIKQKMMMSEANKKKSTVGKVFSILIEQVQNIIHYSDEKYPADNFVCHVDQLSVGIIAVGIEDQYSSVVCGNRIKTNNVKNLRHHLLELQTMNKDELKTLYKEKRRMDPSEGSKGAGLGIIEMARRATRPIEFAFKEIDTEHSFFVIKTMV